MAHAIERGFQPPHCSVLYQATIAALHPFSPGKYIDGTIGAGGHAWGILDSSSPGGLLLGLDLDPDALEISSQRLASFGNRVNLVKASYTQVKSQAALIGWTHVSGILVDLGVSSMQLDRPQKGFSFQAEGPLDMRFDPANPTSAALLVNQLAEDDLADLLYRFGEEPQARRIAQAIIRARPISTTTGLADVVSKAVGRQKGHMHPATRTFQALRIAANRELEALEAFLPEAIALLEPQGVLAVISFHSLEDRIVKQFFRKESTDCICPPGLPACVCGHHASVKLVNRQAIVASPEEIKENPRARSARLRIVEKLELA
jgi:16S rRNA (cytosine1402-N4)-methyltransferase